MQGERTSLDAADKAAVDAYNAKVEKRRQMIADYTTWLPDVTGQAQKYSALRQSWEAECDDRPYREGDYQAIPARPLRSARPQCPSTRRRPASPATQRPRGVVRRAIQHLDGRRRCVLVGVG